MAPLPATQKFFDHLPPAKVVEEKAKAAYEGLKSMFRNLWGSGKLRAALKHAKDFALRVWETKECQFVVQSLVTIIYLIFSTINFVATAVFIAQVSLWATGFGLGAFIVGGSFAATRWQPTYHGIIPRGSPFSLAQSYGALLGHPKFLAIGFYGATYQVIRFIQLSEDGKTTGGNETSNNYSESAARVQDYIAELYYPIGEDGLS